MGTILDSPLGRSARYPDAYDAALLYPVERQPQRDELGLTGSLPFDGEDRWTVWETAWLDGERRARTGIATFAVPCASPRIVESKSVKLYFASLNHAAFVTLDALRALLERDLSAATGADVAVAIAEPARWHRHARDELPGEPIDDVVPAAFPDAPDASLLACLDGDTSEALVWHGFRSVCPVTGQPDYASIGIAYDGAPLDRAALAAYLFGFRGHPGFHEHCVERVFVDVVRACAPRRLRVEAWFTRRGGIDINPWRATPGSEPPPARSTLRQ